MLPALPALEARLRAAEMGCGLAAFALSLREGWALAEDDGLDPAAGRGVPMCVCDVVLVVVVVREAEAEVRGMAGRLGVRSVAVALRGAVGVEESRCFVGRALEMG